MTLASARTGTGLEITIAQSPYARATRSARTRLSGPTNRRAAPVARDPSRYPITQPAIIPTHTTAVPRPNPSIAPAAVETILDGTGRITSSASNPAIIAAAGQPA